MDRAELIQKIEAKAAALGVAPSTIGERAGQGGKFYARLKEGYRFWPETAQKVAARIERMGIERATGGEVPATGWVDE